jgi:predicted ferric reductase
MFPFMIFCCMYLPTWWSGFTKQGIRSYQAQNIESGSDEIGVYWKWKVGDETWLKLFPDILMFYLAIYLVVIISVAAQYFPRIRRFLNQRPIWLYRASVGEVSLIAFIAMQIIGQWFYWYFDHKWQNAPVCEYGNKERAARSMGQVANVVMGLLVLPVARNSVWTAVFGISWDAMLKWHTYLGGTFLFIVGLHAAIWWQAWSDDHEFFQVPPEYHTDNFTIPAAILTALFAVPIMGFASYFFIRRNYFEIFHFLHQFSVVIFFVTTWHATMSWYFISAGLWLYAIDILLRVQNCIGTKVIVDEKNIDVIELQGRQEDKHIVTLCYNVMKFSLINGRDMEATSVIAKPGQYMYICIPSISRYEWHPFTISSGPSQLYTSHHIKTMGANTWTQKLFDLVKSVKQGSVSYEDAFAGIQVDGPYGVDPIKEHHEVVCLAAGGIGITPMASILDHFSHRWPKHVKHLKLVWSSTCCRELAIFSEVFERVKKSCPDDKKVEIKLYVTKQPDGQLPKIFLEPNSINVAHGRPNSTELGFVRSLEDKGLVHVCGPPGMISDLSEWTMKNGVDFGYETFEF